MTPHPRARLVALLALALGAAPMAGPLEAQAARTSAAAPEPRAGARAVRISPTAGLIAPDAYFYEYFKNFTGDGLTEWTTGYLGRSLVAGVGAEVRLGNSGAYLRGEVLRSVDAWLSVAHSVETLRDLFIPPEVVVTWLDVPTTITLTSVQVVLPTRFTLGPVEPYVLLGGGGKHYAFGDPTSENDVEATLPEGGFTWSADLGGGLTVRWRRLRIDVEGRDALSTYWGKRQHDLLYTGALSFGVF